MRIINKNHISILLMSSSLLLLGAFLAFWLKKIYQEEVDNLREKSSLIFINSLREAEVQFFKEQFIHPIVNASKQNNSIDEAPLKVVVPSNAHIFSSHFGEKNNTEVRFYFNTNKNIKEERSDKLDNTLLTLLGFKNELLLKDSLNVLHKDSVTIDIIKNVVRTSPKSGSLPSNFSIIKVDDSATDCYISQNDVYTDIENGDQFALTIEYFQPLIFQKMLPQFLFSLLLFSIISLAFFFIYRNLKQQQRLTELKNDLINNITHELKTPIATIGVAIEALQNFDALKNPIRTKEYLDISKQELNRLSILVDKVLNTSLFERSELAIKTEPIDLKMLLEAVINSMKLQFEQQKANVQFMHKGKQFIIIGDAVHLTSVIFNILDNALKYSPSKANININMTQEGEKILLYIKDDGIGIPLPYQSKIFDKFFRVPMGDTPSVKGHGLGLSYVKSVIEKHGGRIMVESIMERGTAFKITLPRYLGMGYE